jgi:hypothetical protein
MNYLNIHTDILRGVEFIGAEPTERATWIALLGWCATQENGGVIDDCKNWKDRQWQQLAGVTVAEVKTMSLLYGFEGENLRLKFYPVESEAAVRAKREKGKLGGRPRIDKSEANPDETKDENHMVTHMVSGSANHERNGKERNGKKWKEKKPPKSAATDELDKDLLLSLWNAAPERARRRSSRKQVADEWRRIPKRNRPAKSATTKAISAWNKCDDWTKDDGSFIPGLHLWIKNEKWLDLPAAATKTPKRILTKEML